MGNDGAFARRVLCPTVDCLDSIDIDEINPILVRLRPVLADSLSGLLHSLHLFGPELEVESTAGPVSAVDLICDAALTKKVGKRFGDGDTLAKTRYGLRFPVIFPWALAINQSNTESHPGQGLATFASLGVPLNTPIVLSNGSKDRVASILNDVVANFTLEGEIYWDAAALALYLPPERSWTNKFGTKYDFDMLVDELIKRPVAGSPCVGTHALIDLTILLRADAETPLLSDSGRKAVRTHLKKVVDRLREVQDAEGGWSPHWSETQPPADPVLASDAVLTVGHHLEWMMLLPSDIRPDRELLKRALSRCLSLLQVNTKDPAWIRKHYCPAVHAARSVWLLSEPAARVRFARERLSAP